MPADELIATQLRTLGKRVVLAVNKVDPLDDNALAETINAQARQLRDEGVDNVGIVLQAMLRRSERDVRDLADYRPDIRLCKGIYREREEVAWQGREEVRDSFKRLLRLIIDGGMRWFGDGGFMASIGETRIIPEDLTTTWKKLLEVFGG